MFKAPIHLLLTICFTPLLLGVTGQESEGSHRVPGLLETLPDPAPFEAEISEGPELFNAENLYEYINGAAEAFIAYDFEQLVHQIYLVGGTEITVDIYDMGTLEDAFGIYSSERGRGSEFLTIGTEGYRAGDVLNFTQDRYYVKLSAFAEAGDASSLLRDFSESVSRLLPVDRGLPETFALLPTTGLVSHSQTYVKRSPLGHRFLSPGYLADYRLGAEDMTVLLSPSADPEEAAGKLARLREHLGKVGEVLPQEKWGKEAFLAKSRYQGNILALAHEHFAVVLVGVSESYEEFLEGLLSGLKESAEK